jgi:hypothetical protein
MAGTLKVDTISENTSAAGVTIDGVLIKDSTSNARLPTAAVLTGATDPIVIATSLVVIARAGAVNATTLAAPDDHHWHRLRAHDHGDKPDT